MRLIDLVLRLCLILLCVSEIECRFVCGVCVVNVCSSFGRNMILLMFDSVIENVCVFVVGLKLCGVMRLCLICVSVLWVVGSSVSVCGVGFILCDVCMNSGLLKYLCSWLRVVFMCG